MSAPVASTVSTATSTPANVHIEIPGFQALSERGHWDACAVIAELDALHVCAWRNEPLTSNTVNAWRWQYIQAGHWSKIQSEGTTLAAIHWHITETAIHGHVSEYIMYSDTPNLAAIHALLKRQCVAGNPVIIQVVNAQALPNNEAGVKSHFVTIGGIDSDRGYLVANGDTLDAFSSPVGATLPLQWASWSTLVNAQISGALALDRGHIAPTPAPVPTPTPAPAPDLNAAAIAALRAALKL